MQGRTFFRIMFDNLFVNNAVAKALLSLIKFCNEFRYFSKRELKFLKKMPLNNIEQRTSYNSKFVFDTKKIGANCK